MFSYMNSCRIRPSSPSGANTALTHSSVRLNQTTAQSQAAVINCTVIICDILLWCNAPSTVSTDFFFYSFNWKHTPTVYSVKIPKRILRFILFLCLLVSGGRCKLIRYRAIILGLPPSPHSGSPHSWPTAVNSLLPASSHGWSICTTSATWSRRRELILMCSSFYVASISLLSFSELFPLISSGPLTPRALSLFLSLCTWVCGCVSLRCPVCKGNMTVNCLKHFPSLSLILCALTQTHHRQYLCFMGLLKKK